MWHMVETVIGGDHPVWAATHGLPPAERLVLVCLAAHAGKDGRSWPSVPRLMEMTGYCERSVRGSLTSLRARGLIEVAEWRFTSESSTVHVLTLPPAADCTGPPAVECTDPLQPTAPGSATPLQPTAPTPCRPLQGPPCSPLHPEVPIEEPDEEPLTKTRAVVVADVVGIATRNGTPTFDDFWAIWPRKVAKRSAQKAWTTAARRASPETILDGARRYATGNLPEPQYIPHPATWLNGDRWDDNPTDIAPPAEPRGFAGIRAALNTNGHLP